MPRITFRLFLIPLIALSLSMIVACRKSEDKHKSQFNHPSENTSHIAIENGSGGYSGGGGNLNTIESSEFKEFFNKTVKRALLNHSTLISYLGFLKLQNQLPKNFEPILKSAINSNGKIIIPNKIEVKFKELCPSKNRGASHASTTDYNLNSTICISAKGLNVLSKSYLQRKIQSLISHEFVHLLGFKDEALANSFQNFVYSNYPRIISPKPVETFFSKAKLLFFALYHHIYTDCLIDNRCTYDINKKYNSSNQSFNESKKDQLIRLFDQAHQDTRLLGVDYSNAAWIIEDLIQDSSFSRADFEFDNGYSNDVKILADLYYSLKANDSKLDMDAITKQFENFLVAFIEVNFIQRASHISLPAKEFFSASTCWQPTPLVNPLSQNLFDQYFKKNNFDIAQLDSEFKEMGFKTIYLAPFSYYILNYRLCGEDNIPLREWLLTKP